MELWCIQLLVIAACDDDVELWCLQSRSYNVSDYGIYWWLLWFWTAFYLIMERNVIACFLRQDFQWGWSMSGSTTLFVWVLLMYLQYCYYVYCIFLYFNLCIIFCTSWNLLWFNRYTWTNWCTIFIGHILFYRKYHKTDNKNSCMPLNFIWKQVHRNEKHGCISWSIK